MKKNKFSNITLLGVDCVDVERLIKSAEICLSYFDFASVKILSSIPSNNFDVIKIDPIRSRKEYSKFIIKKLNEYVDTDYVLIIQYDAFILNPEAWTDKFLEYDYIGAPWWYEDDRNVGNGGFSLRSKKLLKVLAESSHIRKYQPEDHHICRTYRKHLESKGIRFAPDELAERFSIEGVQHKSRPLNNNVWSNQFGFHGLHKTNISKWLKSNPQYKSINNKLKSGYINDVK